MSRVRLSASALIMVVAASVCHAQTTLTVNFSGIMVFIPPGNPGDRMGIALVDATSDPMQQHKGYVAWDPAKTTVPSTTGWNCSSIANSWKACDLGPAGESVALNFTTAASLSTGPNFNCIVPIQQAAGDFNMIGTNLLSTVQVARGAFDSTYNDTSFWRYQNICVRPSEKVTLTANADLTKSIQIVSSTPGKSDLAIGRAAHNSGAIELWILNIIPNELSNVANGSQHYSQTSDPHYLLYQKIIPAGGPTLQTPSTDASCTGAACAPMKDQDKNKNGSNCPPVRIKPKSYQLPPVPTTKQ